MDHKVLSRNSGTNSEESDIFFSIKIVKSIVVPLMDETVLNIGMGEELDCNKKEEHKKETSMCTSNAIIQNK